MSFSVSFGMRATHLAWRCLSSLGNHSHSRPKLSCIAINNRRFNKDSSSTSGGGDYVIIGSESNEKSQTGIYIVVITLEIASNS